MSFLPHVLPYLLYVGVGAAAGILGPWADPARAVIAAVALLVFFRRGAYPELRRMPSVQQMLLGIATGLAVGGAAWIEIAKRVAPDAVAERTGLDTGGDVALVVFRILGMVAVIPFAEELLVRSALPRAIDAPGDADWRTRAVGSFTPVSAAVSVAFFTFSHPMAEWASAVVTGVVWTVLLAKTRNLAVIVLSHVAANAWIAGYVLVTGDVRWW